MPLMGSLVDWIQLVKELLNLRICQMETSRTEKQRKQTNKNNRVHKNYKTVIENVTYT